MTHALTDQEIVRREKLKKLKEMGIDPYGHAYQRTTNTKEINETYHDHDKEALNEINKEVKKQAF